MKRYLFTLTALLAVLAIGCQPTGTPKTGNDPKTNVGTATTTDAGLTKDECSRLGLENRANTTCVSGNACFNPNADAGRGKSLCTTD